MFNNPNIGLPQLTRPCRDVPYRLDPDDCCLSCCKTFCIAFTFTGFVSCLISALYFLFLMDKAYFPFFLICAAICLAVMIHLITMERPFPPPSLTLDDIIMRRTNISRNTLSLPAYIVVPNSERGETESSGASTESTLSAEENQEGIDVEAAGSSLKTDMQPLASTESTLSAEKNREGIDVEAAGSSLKTDMQPLALTESTLSAETRETIDVEAAGSSRKTDVQPLDGEELEEATEAVLKVVDETLQGVGCVELGEGLASRLADGARRLILEGVRQRRQPPNQPQKNVPSSEDEKAE